MTKKSELINMLDEFRQLTRMIQRANVVAHDDISFDEWSEKLDTLEKDTAQLIKENNARETRKRLKTART